MTNPPTEYKALSASTKMVDFDMPEFIAYKHSANSGDAIYSLAGIRAHSLRSGVPANYYQRLGVRTKYFQGAPHPLGDRMMTPKMWNMLRPLIQHQKYINRADIFLGQPFHFDLDMIRRLRIGLPAHNIAKWYQFVYPQLWVDLSEPWLEIPPGIESVAKDNIIINITHRYRNEWISYQFLQHTYKQYNIFFVGSEEEYLDFKTSQVGRCTHLQPDNFLSLANAISQCKLFLGNQSMCFALAEALKAPRAVELFEPAPNVDPCGPTGWMYYTQISLEYYVQLALDDKKS